MRRYINSDGCLLIGAAAAADKDILGDGCRQRQCSIPHQQQVFVDCQSVHQSNFVCLSTCRGAKKSLKSYDDVKRTFQRLLSSLYIVILL